MKPDSHNDKAADFSVYPWVPKSGDRKSGKAVSHAASTHEVLYVLNPSARLLAPIASRSIDVRDGDCYSFASSHPPSAGESGLIVTAHAAGGRLHYQIAACSYWVSYEGVIHADRIRILTARSTELTTELFLDQCEALIPTEYQFRVFRSVSEASTY